MCFIDGEQVYTMIMQNFMDVMNFVTETSYVDSRVSGHEHSDHCLPFFRNTTAEETSEFEASSSSGFSFALARFASQTQ